MYYSPTITTPSTSTFLPNQTSPLPQNSTGDLPPVASLPNWLYTDGHFCLPNFHFLLCEFYNTDKCLSGQLHKYHTNTLTYTHMFIHVFLDPLLLMDYILMYFRNSSSASSGYYICIAIHIG